MSRAEAFAALYPLTPLSEKLLASVLTGHEQPLRINHAMIDRLKEEGARAGLQLLALALLDGHIRIYFRATDGLYIKDIPQVSADPGRDLFLSMVAYNFSPDDSDGDFYLETDHLPC